MSICYLVGAGDFYSQLSTTDEDIIIAADGGYDNLASHGYTPNVLVGDFDSIKREIPEGVRTVKYPEKKDETDMFLAYEEGVKLGFSDFVLIGATGGRLDHTYANLSLLLYAKEHGHNLTIIDSNGIILCIKNEAVTLTGSEGAYLSVFAVGGVANGVTISGAEYEVKNTSLSPAFPLGVSNRFKDCPAYISVEDGALLIIAE